MKLPRLLQLRGGRKNFLVAILIGLATIAVSTGAFVVVASAAQPDFQPIHEPISPEKSALIDQIPKYRRPEDATYLTFPEWYLVFNPQEYAEFLRTQPPSGFPYFKSIHQFWQGYAQVYGITKRNYPFNYGAHLMVGVIGTSSTIEWIIKGTYENTVGRSVEWLSGGAQSEEDAFAAQVAKDYGNFVPTQPWFDFPFGHKLAGLWSTTGFFGPHFLRKLERKFSLSLEYGVKSLYAGVIRLASHAVYGIADTEIYASAHDLSEKAFAIPGVKKIKPLGDQGWIITVPHYQGFTETVPLLAREGVQFDEIAGNDEILLTLIAPAAWNYDLTAGRPLFTMELLAGGALKRVAIQAPVKSLGQMLREIESKGLRLEHLFDY